MSIVWYIPFSNTTSYSTFYAFFSSFRIAWFPMWLANIKRQPCFLSTIVTRTRRHTEPTKKNLTNLMGNLRFAREHSVQFFVQFFFTNLMGNLRFAREHSVQFFVQFFFTNLMGNLRFAREHSVQFFVQFFFTNLMGNLRLPENIQFSFSYSFFSHS